ncbi:MAG: DUF5050 domain-containing protein [Oscillospiraceae bacterium]|jgi:hypothetical protein|nr:DUF5050 domain-containing protein [Oscillospiraceae bacterium]
MYCSSCGNQSPDDSAFCVSCGAALNAPPIQQAQYAQPQQAAPPVPQPTLKAEASPKKPFPTKIILSVVSAVLVVAVAAAGVLTHGFGLIKGGSDAPNPVAAPKQDVIFMEFGEKLVSFGDTVRVLLDGQKEIWDFIVEGDWIFYLSQNAAGTSICRVKTDGTGFEQLRKVEDPVCMRVVDGWIYCGSYLGSDYGITRMKTDGSEFSTIANSRVDFGETESFEVIDNFVYFTAADYSGYYIGKMHVDGTQLSKIYNLPVDSWGQLFATQNNHMLVFVSEDGGSGESYLLSMAIDGSNPVKIPNSSERNVSLRDGYIIYQSEDLHYGRMNLDGTGKQDYDRPAPGKLDGPYSYSDWIQDNNNFYNLKTGEQKPKPSGILGKAGDYIIGDWCYALDFAIRFKIGSTDVQMDESLAFDDDVEKLKPGDTIEYKNYTQAEFEARLKEMEARGY